MEALLFTLDSLVIVLIVYMSLRDDRQPVGAALTSLFRARDLDAPPAPARRRGGRPDLPAEPWAESAPGPHASPEPWAPDADTHR